MAGLLNQAAPQSTAKASPQDQAKYKTLVTQVVKFMSQPQVTQQLKQLTDQYGAEKALAMIIGQALQLVGQAAKQSGASVSMDTGKAALKEIVTVFASLLASAGKVQDVNQTVAEVMEMVMSGGQNPDAAQEQPQEEEEEPAPDDESAEPMGV